MQGSGVFNLPCNKRQLHAYIKFENLLLTCDCDVTVTLLPGLYISYATFFQLMLIYPYLPLFEAFSAAGTIHISNSGHGSEMRVHRSSVEKDILTHKRKFDYS